ncbi:hypothetical protein [Lactococcus garvieae]|jgi:hypothetical protein|uniref:Uncharacterized protein n=1 Tax=Lactococcus garvieae DCC43 TaxID=1231377 RepID=K2PN73_9LACT|nr:hypothetical protein [Lactococcus garvieae]EKF51684.1 hypothetical protein C426_1011 [Lactococcus garvieae DCC43]QPS71314.1 hypothetical protein I6G50_01220 [Lactococcus garvieae]
MNLKITGILLILLGGTGLLFLKQNSLLWYGSVVVAFIGSGVYSRADKKQKNRKNNGN